MSLFSWLRGSNGMADSAQMGRPRRRRAPSHPAPRFRPRLEALEDRTVPSTIHVADVAGLQAAVAAVSADPSHPATIMLDPGTYHLTSELLLAGTRHLTIQGDPSGSVILDNPSHSDRIFEFDDGDVAIDGLVITGGGSVHVGVGGGIFAYNCTLTIDHSTISGNSAGDSGGGIWAYLGSLTVKDSTLSSNSANDGGGIWAGFITLTIDHSTISGNSANDGGGIYAVASTLTVRNSTIAGNSAVFGGGIYFNGGAMTVNNSAFTNNTADIGGAIYIAAGDVRVIKNATFTDNFAAISDPDIYGPFILF